MNIPILVLLSLGHLVTDLSQGALPLLLPGLKELFQLSYTQVGLIILMANLSSSIIQPLFGYYSDRFRSPWLMPGGTLLTALGISLLGFVPSYGFLLAVVFLSGLGVASFHPEASKTAHFASGDRKSTSMAVFSVGGNLGLGLGPLAATLALWLGGVRGTVWLLLPGTVMFLLLWKNMAAMPCAETKGSASPAVTKPLTGREALTLFFLVSFVVLRSWIHAGVTNYIPLYYVTYLGGKEGYPAILLTAFLVAGAVGTILGGPLADRWGGKRLITLSMLATLPLLYWLRHSSGAWTLLPMALSGMTVISTFAPTIVLGQQMLPQRIGVASGLMMGFGIGMGGVGATLLGVIADRWGVPSVLVTLNLLPLVGILLMTLVPGGQGLGQPAGTRGRE